MLDDLEAYYYRALPRRAYHAHDVQAMLRTLGDPYTRYLPPAAYTQLKRGRGGHLSRASGWRSCARTAGCCVTASIPGLPGRAAGIRPGDVITTIDGTSLASLSYRRALDLIGGRVGSAMHLADPAHRSHAADVAHARAPPDHAAVHRQPGGPMRAR